MRAVIFRRNPVVFRPGNSALHSAHRQNRIVDLQRFHRRLDHTLGIIGIINRIISVKGAPRGDLRPQNPRAKAVKGCGSHAEGVGAHHALYPLAKLPCRFIGKGNRHDIPWIYSLFLNQICNTVRQHTRFS